jgi:hypothetical protein
VKNSLTKRLSLFPFTYPYWDPKITVGQWRGIDFWCVSFGSFLVGETRKEHREKLLSLMEEKYEQAGNKE